IYDSVLIASVVLGIIIIYFFISVIRQQRINLKLRKKSILSEITGLEKERARIAADLHDELGPLLSAVKMRINSFELPEQDDKEQLEKTNHHIDDVIKRMREISFDLMPNSLLKRGLAIALTEYFNFLGKENSTRFIFINEADFIIGENKSVNIYRIVQEVIHNSLKHAYPTEIKIELKMNNNKILLTVTDNGKGFDYKKALTENTGIGLSSINNRSQMIGAKMFVNSSKENGTKFMFEIPV
ncbi:MAG: sensor histidine kinase, partial [Ginsengibacter sp.]